LAAVYPMFDTSTMLHEGAAKSSQIERMSGYADKVVARYPITENDTVLLASTSGINSFIIEFAQCVKEKGAKVIGITSYAYLKKPSRHKDGLHLFDVCDLAIDNHVPTGDATVTVCEDGTKAGPISSVATLAICDAIELATCQSLRERGIDPEVFRSGNVEGSDEYNGRLIRKFQSRVRSL
ncbi:MAG: sugar isomerase domain-containing protein, partial [Oscillospiraceae bacterium]|nr:sugar isomerase domain-containing protein [Oscillospiraceae bacterium]